MKYESDIITVATVNFKPVFGNKQANVSRIKDYIHVASRRGVDLIVFPEMCVVGYDYYIDERISKEERVNATEPFTGKTNLDIAEHAKKLGIYCVYGAAEQDEKSGDIFNSAIACGPEGLIGIYRKIHPYENENCWCVKGSDPFMFDTKWGPVSVGICYDTYQFPELLRYYASKGSRLYLNPTALVEEITINGSREAMLDFYLTTLNYGVVANTIFIASANLLGYDGNNYFGGASGIIGPEVQKHADTFVTWYAGGKDNLEPGLSIATIDLTLARRKIFNNDVYAKEPDYRPDVYMKFWKK